ncbi:MAG: hypothetical protein K8S56_03860 [Candidatus Cloacimonetes bacterium]|nr:hypothetical protein [Candidatus Cloacimonadota bacterium]
MQDNEKDLDVYRLIHRIIREEGEAKESLIILETKKSFPNLEAQQIRLFIWKYLNRINDDAFLESMESDSRPIVHEVDFTEEPTIHEAEFSGEQTGSFSEHDTQSLKSMLEWWREQRFEITRYLKQIPGTRKKHTINLNIELADKTKQYAESMGTSFSEIMNHLMQDLINQK